MSTTLLVQDYINAQLASRHHEFVEWPDLIKRIPRDRTLEGAYIGSYSVTKANRLITYVSTQHDWCNLPVSASSVARLILRDGLKLLGRKRIFWNMKSRPLLNIPQPLYCNPLEFGGRLTYVDISGAYYSIYRRLPYDIRFQGLRVYGGKCWFRDFLPTDIHRHKLLRNALVGCLRQLNQARIKQGKINVGPNRNVCLSPEHWGFIAHLLHTIGIFAVQCGARYVNTDGAIFTNDQDAIRYAEQIQEWGLTPRVDAQGSGSIQSIGNYNVGSKFAGCRNPKPLAFNNLIEPSTYVLERWLQWM